MKTLLIDIRPGTIWTIVLLAALLLPTSLFGQTATGSIVGTATDASGGVIVGAAVTLTQVGTNETRTTVTDSRGAYSLTFLQPATYNIAIEGRGFKTFVQKGIILDVDATLTVNAKLPVGAVSQEVTVNSQPALLESQTSSIGQVMNTKTILDLPINGRNSYAFVALVPGVIPSAGFTQTAFDEYNDQFISINGSRPNQNTFLLDGGINTEPALSGPGFYPSVDLVKEYKVQTSNLSAQFSGTSGGVINVITQSGTNSFHGDVYEFLRNNAFDARDFFLNRTTLPTPPYQFNQFGGTIGGPIFRNHTFFFFSYEGLRWNQSVTTTATLPTAAERGGDFSALSQQLYNPFTTAPVPGGYTRQAFTNNQIPSDLIDPVAKTMLGYLPLPNGPGLFNNFTSAMSSPIDKNDYSIRVDQQLTHSSKLFGRYSISTTHQNRPALYGDSNPDFVLSSPDLGDDTLRQQQATISDTTVFSPTLVMDLNSSFVRYHLTRMPPGQGMDVTKLGFPSYFNELPASSPSTFPSIIIPGYGNAESIPNVGSGITFGAFGFVGILNDANQMYNETVNFTKLHGNHSFTFGGDYGGGYFTTERFNNTAGFYIFGQDFTQGPSPYNSSSGDAMASFMLGSGDFGFNYTGGPDEINSFRYWGGYVQDDWRATPSLTLNLGIRYDYESPWWERHNRITGFAPNAVSPLQGTGAVIKGGLTFPGTNGLSGYQFNPDYRTGIQPRLGFAFEIDPSTVIRGGYGIFMGPVYGSGYNNGEVPITGWQGSTPWVTSLDGVTPNNLLGNPYPNGFVFATGNSLGLATDLGQGVAGAIRTRKTSYSEQWNLDFQHTLPGQILFDLAYVGSHAVHLYGDYNANQLPNQYLSMGSALQQQVSNPFYGNPLITPGALSGPTVAQSQLLLPFPQFTGVTMSGASFYGASRYDSLQLKVERRWANGFSVLGSFTWSKLMDNVNATTTGFPGGNYSGGGIQDWDNLAAAWSPSVMHTPQYLAVSSMYELPFGKGRKWLNNRTVTEYVLGGWQLNGIFTAISGSPLQIPMAANTLFNNGGTQLANWNGQDPSGRGPIKDRLDQYFNVDAFSDPGAFTYGNAPRTFGNLLSPGVLNLDASVIKTFPIRRAAFQFRFEAFNVFNHPQFGPPITGIGSGSPAGLITFQANQPRILQIAGKITF
jgi:Carboxypeptidase regulatory-like domain